MPEPATKSFSPAEARRLSRLLAGMTPGSETCEISAHRGAMLELIRRAIAAGLVREQGGTLCPRPEARSFLRRVFSADGEEGFARQHGERATVDIAEPQGRKTVRRNLDESPLASLSRLKARDGALFLPVAALDAGERLASDFHRGQLQPRLTMSFEPRLAGRAKGAPGGQADLCSSALAARQRFNRAVESMGPELAGVAIDVCCFAKGLELVERERQWPVRSAKLMLRAALMTLARHYDPPRAAKAPPTRHWGSDDFRPVL